MLSLRSEVMQMLATRTYTRLRPSAVDANGVGVFAIVEIERGTTVFTSVGSEETVLLTYAELDMLPEPVRRLVLDLCLHLEEGCFVPSAGVASLGMEAYINHGPAPNVAYDERRRCVATESIAPGEELLLDYGQFEADALVRW